jgi:hypothetical protein
MLTILIMRTFRLHRLRHTLRFRQFRRTPSRDLSREHAREHLVDGVGMGCLIAFAHVLPLRTLGPVVARQRVCSKVGSVGRIRLDRDYHRLIQLRKGRHARDYNANRVFHGP